METAWARPWDDAIVQAADMVTSAGSAADPSAIARRGRAGTVTKCPG